MSSPRDDEEGTGRWLRRHEPKPTCRCRPPRVVGSFDSWARGAVGDVWQCSSCGMMWVIKWRRGQPRWRHPKLLGPVWWRFTALHALGRFINAVIDGLTSLTR